MTADTATRLGDVFFVSREKTLCFSRPVATITCNLLESVRDRLQELDKALAHGYHVAGFMSYEAGWGLLERTPCRTNPDMPLLWFGLYQAPRTHPYPGGLSLDFPKTQWRMGVSRHHYLRCIATLRAYIQAGDAYQVNYTFPMTAPFAGDPFAWFETLYLAQPTDHAAYLDLGRFKLLSLSPELFFEVNGEQLTTRPMKGTIKRGLFPAADQQAREQLLASAKEQAENLMIVDLLRNDMGRISDIGSVTVERLFEAERYRTVWQMTSTIQSRTRAPLSEILEALFPCGSVTGAPKLRAMEIIDEVETFARGAYCGTIGWWAPGRRASFNVAIRTLTLDTETGTAQYPVGGGITWDSTASAEYAECLAKATTVMRPDRPFELLETLLYENGYYLLEGHLDRLCASAAYFDIPLSRDDIKAALLQHGASLAAGRWKVRLLLNRQGRHRIEAAPAPEPKKIRLEVAKTPVSTDNLFLYHKTTRRAQYEAALAACPGVDDVLLWNERGELTETTCANIVAQFRGALVTPPVTCGLLPGVMRAELLRRGVVQEGILPRSSLQEITNLFLINAVRKIIPAQLENRVSGDRG